MEELTINFTEQELQEMVDNLSGGTNHMFSWPIITSSGLTITVNVTVGADI